MSRGYLICMNFIIAVVGESYENCITKIVAQTFKAKLDLIVERETIMKAHELMKEDFFPKFIVMRKHVDSEGLLEAAPQWHGFVKEIISTYQKLIEK